MQNEGEGNWIWFPNGKKRLRHRWDRFYTGLETCLEGLLKNWRPDILKENLAKSDCIIDVGAHSMLQSFGKSVIKASFLT